MKFDKNKQARQESEDKTTIRQKIWQTPAIINKLFSDRGWQQFEANTGKTDVPSAQMLNYLQTKIQEQELDKACRQLERQRNIKLWCYSGAVAASFIFIFFFGFWQAPESKNNISQIQPTHHKTITRDPLWLTIENNFKQVKTVQLPDHSTVVLFAHSHIRYPKNFSRQAREIYLNGKATFSVQKDASRPFSVYAASTKTTALGTSFTIDTRTHAHKTAIKLHSGRIVIASTLPTPGFRKAYLSGTGESFCFDSRYNTIERSKSIIIPLSKPAGPAKMNLLNMTNRPLTEVFSALQEAYHIKIRIGSSSIADIQYTGSINIEHDELNDALAVICLINDLRYVTEPDGSYTLYTQSQTPAIKK